MQRRLTTIVAADIAGFSRLVGADEEGTLAAMRLHRADFIDPLVRRYDGRIANTAGDSLLIEFPSAVEAVRWALDLQDGMKERNADVPSDRQIRFRIGINVGDVVAEGNDLLGDGVNIAARLEGLASPGAICLSNTTHDQIRDRLDIALEEIGPVDVKNIARPVRVWRWPAGESPDAASAGDRGASSLPLPDKPSIAVLPFDNMSGDPDQAYFAQGIADDIITGLSKNRWLFVIARNSSFTYPSGAVDTKRIGRELGVRYLLTGSVRRGGDRVRVNAQLVEAESDHHVWADKYDGTINDVFALQDEITTRILRTLGSELTLAEVGRSRQSRSQNFSAWDLYLQALPHAHAITREGLERAENLLQEAVKADPTFSNAFAMLAFCQMITAYQGWKDNVRDTAGQSRVYGERAVSLDPQNPIALTYLGWAHIFFGPQERAASHLRRAIELDPNCTDAWSALGAALAFMGLPDQAVEAIENAKRGSPRDPLRWYWYQAECVADFAANRLEKAIDAAKVAVELQPRWYGSYPILAASAAHLGRMDIAREAVDALLTLVPRLTVNGIERNPIYERPEDASRLIDGLRLAGVPEE